MTRQAAARDLLWWWIRDRHVVEITPTDDRWYPARVAYLHAIAAATAAQLGLPDPGAVAALAGLVESGVTVRDAFALAPRLTDPGETP